MIETYTHVENLIELIDNIPPDSIVSRTFYKDNHTKGVLFGFDTGQELSEHTSSQNAIIQIIKGEAILTLGDDRQELATGAWIHMPPHLKHSIYAKTPLIMLLLMFGTK